MVQHKMKFIQPSQIVIPRNFTQTNELRVQVICKWQQQQHLHYCDDYSYIHSRNDLQDQTKEL